MNRSLSLWAGVAAASVVATAAGGLSQAAITVYPMDLAGFNAAAGTPPIAIDFDDMSLDTDITGQVIAGATLLAPGAPLTVVRAEDTYTPEDVFVGARDITTNVLPATSEPNGLSPGGAELGLEGAAMEDDDLEIVFAQPVRSFGFDHLSQCADGISYTYIQAYNSDDVLLYYQRVPISYPGYSGGPGAADFWGIVSDQADIKRIVFDEGDSNSVYPDANVGYDSLRFFPSVILGDMDGNGVLDAFDVAPFELALTDRLAYLDAYPGLDPDVLGDMDGSRVLDAFDVSGFETALAGIGSVVPEPMTLAPMIAGMVYLLSRRRTATG